MILYELVRHFPANGKGYVLCQRRVWLQYVP